MTAKGAQAENASSGVGIDEDADVDVFDEEDEGDDQMFNDGLDAPQSATPTTKTGAAPTSSGQSQAKPRKCWADLNAEGEEDEEEGESGSRSDQCKHPTGSGRVLSATTKQSPLPLRDGGENRSAQAPQRSKGRLSEGRKAAVPVHTSGAACGTGEAAETPAETQVEEEEEEEEDGADDTYEEMETAVPKNARYFLHDDRGGDPGRTQGSDDPETGGEENGGTRRPPTLRPVLDPARDDRWTHDKFDEIESNGYASRRGAYHRGWSGRTRDRGRGRGRGKGRGRAGGVTSSPHIDTQVPTPSHPGDKSSAISTRDICAPTPGNPATYIKSIAPEQSLSVPQNQSSATVGHPPNFRGGRGGRRPIRGGGEFRGRGSAAVGGARTESGQGASRGYGDNRRGRGRGRGKGNLVTQDCSTAASAGFLAT